MSIPTVYLIELELLRARFNQRQAKELFRNQHKFKNVPDHPWIAIGKIGSLEERLSAVRMKGSEHNDTWNDDLTWNSNHAGGVLAGISNGAPIEIQCAFKQYD